MSGENLHSELRSPGAVERGWIRLGALIAGESAGPTPDLERLIVATARAIPSNPRLLEIVVTWLTRYHPFVAAHRLKRLIVESCDEEGRAVLGLVLEEALSQAGEGRLGVALAACTPVRPERPLSLVDRRVPGFERFAEANASAKSRRWGVLAPDVELRPEVIRPASWVHRHNPSLAERAARHGRLDGSVLATLRLDIEGEAQSVSELARLCAATKAATLRAVRALELEGAVELIREPGSRRHRVRLIEAA